MADDWGSPLTQDDTPLTGNETPPPKVVRSAADVMAAKPYSEDALPEGTKVTTPDELKATSWTDWIPEPIKEFGKTAAASSPIENVFLTPARVLGLANETAGAGYEAALSEVQHRAPIKNRTLSDIGYDLVRAGLVGTGQALIGGKREESGLDPHSPTFIAGDTPQERARFAQNSPVASSFEAFAEPFGRMGMGFLLDPAMVGFVKAGAVAGEGLKAAGELKSLEGAIDPDTAAKLLTAVKNGATANTIQKIVGFSIAPAMIKDMAQGAAQWWQTGLDKGFSSPDALGALGNTIASAGMAYYMGKGAKEGLAHGAELREAREKLTPPPTEEAPPPPINTTQTPSMPPPPQMETPAQLQPRATPSTTAPQTFSAPAPPPREAAPARITPPPAIEEPGLSKEEFDAILKEVEPPEQNFTPSPNAKLLDPKKAVQVANDVIQEGTRQATERQEVVGGLFYPGEEHAPVKTNVIPAGKPGSDRIAYRPSDNTIHIGQDALNHIASVYDNNAEANRAIVRVVAHEISHGIRVNQAGYGAVDPITGEPVGAGTGEGVINPAGGHDKGGLTDSALEDLQHLRTTSTMDRLMTLHPELAKEVAPSTTGYSVDASHSAEAQRLGNEIYGPTFGKGEGELEARVKPTVPAGEVSSRANAPKGKGKFQDFNLSPELEMALPPEVRAGLKQPSKQLDQLNERFKYWRAQGFDPNASAAKAAADVRYDMSTDANENTIRAFQQAIGKRTSGTKTIAPEEVGKTLDTLLHPDARLEQTPLQMARTLASITDIDKLPADLQQKYSNARNKIRQRLQTRLARGRETPSTREALNIIDAAAKRQAGRKPLPRTEEVDLTKEAEALPKEAIAAPPGRGPGRPVERTRLGGPGSDREQGVNPRAMGTAPNSAIGREKLNILMGIPDIAEIKRMEPGAAKAAAIETFLKTQQGRKVELEQRLEAHKAKYGENPEGPIARGRETLQNALEIHNQATRKWEGVLNKLKSKVAKPAGRPAGEEPAKPATRKDEDIEMFVTPAEREQAKARLEAKEEHRISRIPTYEKVQEYKKEYNKSLKLEPPPEPGAPVNRESKYITKSLGRPVKTMAERLKNSDKYSAEALRSGLGKVEAAGTTNPSEIEDILRRERVRPADRVSALADIKRGRPIKDLIDEASERAAAAKARPSERLFPPIAEGEGKPAPHGGRVEQTYRDMLRSAGKSTAELEQRLNDRGIIVENKQGKAIGKVDMKTGILTKLVNGKIKHVDLAQRTSPDIGQRDYETRPLTKKELARGVTPEEKTGAVRRTGGGRVLTGGSIDKNTLRKALLEGGRTRGGRPLFDPDSGEPLRLRMPHPEGEGSVVTVGGAVISEKGNPIPSKRESFREPSDYTVRGGTDRISARQEDLAKLDPEDIENIQKAYHEVQSEPSATERFATDKEIDRLLQKLGNVKGNDKQIEKIKEALSGSMASRLPGQLEATKYDQPGRVTKQMERGIVPPTKESGEGYTSPIGLKKAEKVTPRETSYVRPLNEEEIAASRKGQPSLYELDKLAKGVSSTGVPRVAGKALSTKEFIENANNPDLKVKGVGVGMKKRDTQNKAIRTTVVETATPSERFKEGVSLKDLAELARDKGLTRNEVEQAASDLFDHAQKQGLVRTTSKDAWMATARREYVKATGGKFSTLPKNFAQMSSAERSAWLDQRLSEESKIAPPPKAEGPEMEATVAPRPYKRNPYPNARRQPVAPVTPPEPLTRMQKFMKRIDAEIGEFLREDLNVTRAAASSMDLSAPFRQTAMATAVIPGRRARLWNMTKAWVAENHAQLTKQMQASPSYQEALKAGVNFVRESGQHEAFRGIRKASTLIEHLGPKAEKAFDLTIGGSERSYTYMQNASMHDMWKHGKAYLQSIKKWNDASARELATFVNDAGSRSKIADTGLKNTATALFFSPQMIKSRLRVLKGAATGFQGMDTAARRYAAKTTYSAMGVGAATMMAIYAGAAALGRNPQIETDPRSTDFGKVRVGSVAIDPWAGYQQYLRFGAQMITGQYKKLGSGKIAPRNRLENLESFIRSKLAPGPGLIVSMLDRKDVLGRETKTPKGLLRAVTNATAPMALSDIVNMYQEDPVMASAMVVPIMLGMSVSSGTAKSNYLDTPALKQSDIRVNDELRRLHLEGPRLSRRVSLPGHNQAGQKYYYHLQSAEAENLEAANMPKVTEILDAFIQSDAYQKMDDVQKTRALAKRLRFVNSQYGANKVLKASTIERLKAGEITPSNEWWNKK